MKTTFVTCILVGILGTASSENLRKGTKAAAAAASQQQAESIPGQRILCNYDPTPGQGDRRKLCGGHRKATAEEQLSGATATTTEVEAEEESPESKRILCDYDPTPGQDGDRRRKLCGGHRKAAAAASEEQSSNNNGGENTERVL